MLSIDTETTGLDLFQGARPYFVTTCGSDGEQKYWEWSVNPFTREVEIPEEDAREIRQLLSVQHKGIVGHNIKFDIAMLREAGVADWSAACLWDRTHDTLFAGHLLASNRPHNLTDMALQYLGADIEPKEKELEKAVQKARRVCRSKGFQAQYGVWAIADEDREDMPSAKQKTWKYDTWLPRAMIVAGYQDKQDSETTDGWDMVLSEYANTDSAITLALWNACHEELHRRGLWEIYESRRKLIRIASAMEQRGITLSRSRLEEMEERVERESEELGSVCVNIAKGYNYDLSLPKSGSNGSLKTFVFDVLNLPRTKHSEKTGEPGMDKGVVELWEKTLPPRSKELTFVKALSGKRKRDTAKSYIEGYKRFWLQIEAHKKPVGVINEICEYNVPDGPIATFIRAIIERPKDPQRYLVLSDFLEERGESSWAADIRKMVEWGTDWYLLHPSLNPTGTDTLRWSSSQPNEQNISKQEGFNLRYIFGPAPGREWWSLDAQNIELRIPAFEAGEKDLIEVFLHPENPPYYGSYHLVVFDALHPEMFKQHGKACKDIYESTWYQWVKNGDFALIYGAQEATTDATFHVKGAYNKIRHRFPEIAKLSDKWLRFAEKHGYVETIHDKSVNPDRGYPLLCTRSDWGRVLPTVPLNYHTSGTAMQWMNLAMVRCSERLDTWSQMGEDVHMALQVHDELVFDFPSRESKGNLQKVRELQGLMEKGGGDIGVPTPVSVEYHENNWATGERV